MLDAQFVQTLQKISSLKADLEQGKLVDAQVVGAEVNALLSSLKEVSKAEAETYLPQLQKVVDGLDQLTLGYEAIAGQTKSNLERLNQVSRASTAYAQRGAQMGQQYPLNQPLEEILSPAHVHVDKKET